MKWKLILKSPRFVVSFRDNLNQFRANCDVPVCTSHSLVPRWPDGTNPDFFRSDFSTFWLTEPKCTEIRSENVPDMSKYGPIWPTPEPNSISLSSDGLVLAYYKKIWMLICALIWIIQIILKLRTITYSKYFYYWIKKPGVIFVPLLTDTLL